MNLDGDVDGDGASSCVICNTCGRDNPAHLIFCQECGQKLAPRGASATPPAGLRARLPEGVVGPFDATAASPLEPAPPSEVQRPAPPEAARPFPRSGPRPAAPEMTFQRRPPRDEAAQTVCPLCGSKNQRDLRFCVTCGHVLAQGDGAPAPTATAEPSPVMPSVPAEFGPAVVPIAPARVVEVGTVAPSTQRLCPRCRGGCESTAQFCRFCGASLSEAREIELAPIVHEPPPRAAATEAPTPRDSPRPSRSTAEPPGRAADGASATRVASSPPPPQAVSLTATAALQSTAPARARLVLVARDGGEGPKYGVGEATDIGRAEGHVIIADDRYLSPRHARVAQRAGAYYLRDLGSTNGVFLRIPFANDLRQGDAVGHPSLAASSGQAGQRDALGPGKDPDEQGDKNASLVDGLEQPLEDQDLFLLGQQVLRFEVVKDAEEGFGAGSENGTLLFGTPAAPRYARLSQRTVEGVVRDVFHLRKVETVIGRESGDVVFTDDPFLSRRHAVVRVHGTPGSAASPRRFTLADLGSSNGTFLQIRREIRLRNGDHFRIGQQLFRFDLDAAHADA